MATFITPSTTDLPPRTWRRWWLEWPKWFRIGCYAVAGVVALNLALAMRMMLGWHEVAAIRKWRARGVKVEYFWEASWELVEHQNDVAGAFYGRTLSNVSSIQLDQLATDADLQLISSHCGSLQKLSLKNAPVSSEAIGLLGHCRRLENLSLRGTDADDAAIEKLVHLDELGAIDLYGTLVSDAAVPVLQSLPMLGWIDVQYTDVTHDAVAGWRETRSDLTPIIATEKDRYPRAVLGAILWSDGELSGTFPGKYEISVQGPLEADQPRRRQWKGQRLDRSILWWRNANFTSRKGGRFELTLTLNQTRAEPTIITVADGVPSKRLLEFRMPCTKAEALRSAESDVAP